MTHLPVSPKPTLSHRLKSLTLDFGQVTYLFLPSLSSHQPEKAIKSGLKALESLGFVIYGGHLSDSQLEVKTWGLMSDGVVGCWMLLGRAYRDVALGLEVQAVEYARISYRICVGEDDTFDGTYGKLSARVDGLLVTVR